MWCPCIVSPSPSKTRPPVPTPAGLPSGCYPGGNCPQISQSTTSTATRTATPTPTRTKVLAGTAIPASEKTALTTFYTALGGSSWKKRTNWLSTTVNPCSWFGVLCSGGHVVGLLLNGNGLSGTIPSTISALTALQYVWEEGRLR